MWCISRDCVCGLCVRTVYTLCTLSFQGRTALFRARRKHFVRLSISLTFLRLLLLCTSSAGVSSNGTTWRQAWKSRILGRFESTFTFCKPRPYDDSGIANVLGSSCSMEGSTSSAGLLLRPQRSSHRPAITRPILSLHAPALFFVASQGRLGAGCDGHVLGAK